MDGGWVVAEGGRVLLAMCDKGAGVSSQEVGNKGVGGVAMGLLEW